MVHQWIAPLGTALLVTVLVANSHAQVVTPRESLTQLIAELQRAPDNVSLRERIIKLVRDLRPAPEIPEQARRHFIRAAALQKAATDAAGYDFAIREYREALLIAPWWPEAYFNLSTVQETAGRLDDAVAALTLYLSTEPGADDARAARDRIYAIEAKKELAAKTAVAKVDAERRQREEQASAEAKKKTGIEALVGRWRGTTQWAGKGKRGDLMEVEMEVIIRGTEVWVFAIGKVLGTLRGVSAADRIESIRWETGDFSSPPPSWVPKDFKSYFPGLGSSRPIHNVEISSSLDRLRYRLPMKSSNDDGTRYHFLDDVWYSFDLRKER